MHFKNSLFSLVECKFQEKDIFRWGIFLSLLHSPMLMWHVIVLNKQVVNECMKDWKEPPCPTAGVKESGVKKY